MRRITWIRLLGFGLFTFISFPLCALPLVPESLPVTVLLKSPLPVGTVAADLVERDAYDQVPGVLFTRVEALDRERPKVRMQPLVTYRTDSVLELDWMDGRPLALALERLRMKEGMLLFELEDDTWAFGRPEGIQVKELTASFSLYLTVRVWDLLPTERGTLTSRVRMMDIPLQDVADRVFSVPTELDSAPDSSAAYFLSADGEAWLPITVLGFESDSAWVCATRELENPGLYAVGIYTVRPELLRRVSQTDLATKQREATRNPIPLQDLSTFLRQTVKMPAHGVDRLQFLKSYLHGSRDRWKPHVALTRDNCATVVANALQP